MQEKFKEFVEPVTQAFPWLSKAIVVDVSLPGPPMIVENDMCEPLEANFNTKTSASLSGELMKLLVELKFLEKNIRISIIINCDVFCFIYAVSPNEG